MAASTTKCTPTTTDTQATAACCSPAGPLIRAAPAGMAAASPATTSQYPLPKPLRTRGSAGGRGPAGSASRAASPAKTTPAAIRSATAQ